MAVPTWILPSHVTLLWFVVATYLLLFQLSNSFCYEYVVKIPLLLGGIYLSLMVFQAAQEQRRPSNPNKPNHQESTSIRQQHLDYRERLIALKEKELEKKWNQLERSLATKTQVLKTQPDKRNSHVESLPLLVNNCEWEELKNIKTLPKETMSFKESDTHGKERKTTKRKWFRRRFFLKKTV
ncbi:hypothetical protein GpartN1_g5746.t1 [Galdieria partita]|uniref:Uncharacterized protein n=1 Tax=Galdieria partita TaxID=83374 RepID=A0A9C7Q0R1_9RHOD|nr:hypothetical protein GpartN1_g5746.t1 [Galdieria partita]